MSEKKSIFEPFISIIIATRNEENYIGLCLESLAKQTYPKDKFEVIILDGISNDKTLSIVEKFSERINLQVVANRKIKHVFAFNSGIEIAKGDYFIILSGHFFVNDNFLKKNVEVFAEMRENQHNLAAVGGR